MKGEMMANRRITLSKLKEIIKLYEKNLAKSQIANALGISRPTLNNYLSIIEKLNIKYSDVCNMADSEVKGLFNFDKNFTNPAASLCQTPSRPIPVSILICILTFLPLFTAAFSSISAEST